MNVFLVRVSLREENAPHLSIEGRQTIRAMGAKMVKEGAPNVDRVLVKNDPAAIQTAELLADRLDFLGAVEVLPSLDASVPAQVAAQAVLARGEAVLIVADEPELSALGAFLVGRPTFPQLDAAQVSAIENREAVWYSRPNTPARLPLNVA